MIRDDVNLQDYPFYTLNYTLNIKTLNGRATAGSRSTEDPAVALLFSTIAAKWVTNLLESGHSDDVLQSHNHHNTRGVVHHSNEYKLGNPSSSLAIVPELRADEALSHVKL